MIKNGFIFVQDSDGTNRLSIRLDDLVAVYHMEDVYHPGATGCRIQFYNRFTSKMEEIECPNLTVDDVSSAMVEHQTPKRSEPFSVDGYVTSFRHVPPSVWRG